MNFIYIIGLFLSISLSAFGLAEYTTGEWSVFYTTVSILSGLATLTTIIIMIFYNINSKTSYKEYFNDIREYKAIIKHEDVNLNRYKTEFKEMFTELYPNYEKDIFNGMNPIDIDNLSAILVKYPELKFDGMLKQYLNGIAEILNRINSQESYVFRSRRLINNIDCDGWMFGKVEIPEDIK